MQHHAITARSEQFIIDFGNSQKLYEIAISDQPIIDLRNNECSISIIQTNTRFELYLEPITINIAIDGSNINANRIPLHATKVNNQWQFTMQLNEPSDTYVCNILDDITRTNELKKLFASILMLVQHATMKPIIFLLDSEEHEVCLHALCTTIMQNARFTSLLTDYKHVIIRHEDELRGYAFFQSLRHAITDEMRFLVIEHASRAIECHLRNDMFTYTTIVDIPEEREYDGIAVLYGDFPALDDTHIILTNQDDFAVMALLGYIRWYLDSHAYASFSEEQLEQHIYSLTQELSMWQNLRQRIAHVVTSLDSR